MIALEHRIEPAIQTNVSISRYFSRHVQPDMDAATHTADVIDAWRLVYRVYLHAGLIDQNPAKIHTTMSAVAGNSVVFLKRSADQQVQCTVTGIVDGNNGVPLDRVYGREINALRDSGRKVMELGLLAHRNQISPAARRPAYATPGQVNRESIAHAKKTGRSLMCMMRPTYWYGLYNGVTDFLIGVHPKHARTYIRAWGFKPFGTEKSYATVNYKPVVLLRLDHVQAAGRCPCPYALGYAIRNRIPRYVYKDSSDGGIKRMCMTDDTIRGYLRERSAQPDQAA